MSWRIKDKLAPQASALSSTAVCLSSWVRHSLKVVFMFVHMTKTVLSSEADKLIFSCTEVDMLSRVKVRDSVSQSTASLFSSWKDLFWIVQQSVAACGYNKNKWIVNWKLPVTFVLELTYKTAFFSIVNPKYSSLLKNYLMTEDWRWPALNSLSDRLFTVKCSLFSVPQPLLHWHPLRKTASCLLSRYHKQA